ncbi:sensory box/GGDEF family domain protein, partial [Vibrio parahaemolyticus EKP-028]
LLTAV